MFVPKLQKFVSPKMQELFIFGLVCPSKRLFSCWFVGSLLDKQFVDFEKMCQNGAFLSKKGNFWTKKATKTRNWFMFVGLFESSLVRLPTKFSNFAPFALTNVRACFSSFSSFTTNCRLAVGSKYSNWVVYHLSQC